MLENPVLKGSTVLTIPVKTLIKDVEILITQCNYAKPVHSLMMQLGKIHVLICVFFFTEGKKVNSVDSTLISLFFWVI